jgi:hypothetical protein
MMKKLFALVTISIGCITSAKGGETAIPVTIPGGTDLSQALIPPSGLYGAITSIPFNRDENLIGPNGQPVAPSSNIKQWIPINVGVLAYVYPFDVLGGRLETTVAVPYYGLCYIVHQASEVCGQGLGDVHSDLFYWGKNLGLFGVTPGTKPLPYGLNIAGGFEFSAPTGVYNPSHSLNISSDIWVAIPNIALTYTTGPNWSLGGDSTEISGRLFYGVPFSNPKPYGLNAAGYLSGNVLDIDWSATERYGDFRAGLAGAYQVQTTDDIRGNGTLPNNFGNRYYGFQMGPIVEYHIPGTRVSVKLKYANKFVDENVLNQQFVLLSVSGALY